MSTKVIVHDYDGGVWSDDNPGGKTYEYDGDNIDAQLHGSGALVVIEHVPDLVKADGTTVPKLLAIHKCWDYVEAV